MKRRMIAVKRALALVLILTLTVIAAPAALAESFAAFVQYGGAPVFSNAALSNAIGSLDQYSVVNVVDWEGNVAAVLYYGNPCYMRVQDLKVVEGNCEEATLAQQTKIYIEPKTSSASLTVARGTKVHIIQNYSNGWTLLEKDGVGAYAKNPQFTGTSPDAFTATPAPTQAPSTANAIPGTVTAASVKVYQSASASSKYLGTMHYGTQVNVLSWKNGWAFVELNGSYGYCALSALTRNDQLNQQPVATPAPAVTPAPTQAPSIANAIPATVTAASVKVYLEAKTSSRYLGTMHRGTQVNVLSWRSGWAHVELNGSYGYCALSALTRNDQLNQQPAATPTPVPTQAPSLENAVPSTVTAASVKVYQEAKTSSRYLGTMHYGTKVNVVSWKGGWAHVELNGSYGYCALSALTRNDQLGQQPVATPTPAPVVGELTGVGKAVTATVSAASVKVYPSMLSISGESLGTIHRGTTVNVIREQYGWAYVELNGNLGYCQASALKYNGTPTAPNRLTDDSVAYALVTAGSVKALPSMNPYDTPLGVFAKNTVVRYYMNSNGWAVVDVNGTRAYCDPKAMLLIDAPWHDPFDATVTAASTAVYQEANTSSARLGTITQGTQVKLYYYRSGWSLISLDGKYGYVPESAVTRNDQLTSPVPTLAPTPTPAPTAVPGIEGAIPATVTAASVQVFQYASTTSQYLGTMHQGTQVNVISWQGGWAYIELNGSYGYCALAALTRNDQLGATPTPAPDLSGAIVGIVNTDVRVYAEANTSSRYLGTLGVGTKVNVIQWAGGWAYIELNGNYGYCALTSLTPEDQVSTGPAMEYDSAKAAPGTVTVDGARVYQSASTVSGVIKTLTKNTEIVVGNWDEASGWALVIFDGGYGYCQMSNLKLSGLANVPAPSGKNGVYAVVTADNFGFYERPLAYGSKRTLPKGALCTVNSIGDGWAHVSYGGNDGYCPITGITLLSALTELPALSGYIMETFDATVITSATLNLGSGTYGQSVDLPRGTALTVFAYTNSSQYTNYAVVQVNATGQRGVVNISDGGVSRDAYDTLQPGSTGDAVKKLETYLFRLGYLDNPPGTNFTTTTAASVKAFQQQVGLSATGAADAATQRILYCGIATESPFLSKTFQQGNSGDEVKRIQFRLYSLGFLSKTSSVDGAYGTTTVNAVKLFQRYQGQEQTGIASGATLRMLYRENAVRLPEGGTAADGVYLPPAYSGNAGNQVNNSPTITDELASRQNTYNKNMSTVEKLEYVIYMGQNQLGKPYVYAEEGPNAFDCTGFTWYCFRQIGITLKRSAREQGYDETYTRITNPGELKRGDLVFFDTVIDDDLSDHAGIYLGAGYFIHSSSGQAKVVVSSLASGYYSRVFSWGHRVLE